MRALPPKQGQTCPTHICVQCGQKKPLSTHAFFITHGPPPPSVCSPACASIKHIHISPFLRGNMGKICRLSGFSIFLAHTQDIHSFCGVAVALTPPNPMTIPQRGATPSVRTKHAPMATDVYAYFVRHNPIHL